MTETSIYEDCLPLPYPMTVWWQHQLVMLTRYRGDDLWEALNEDGEEIAVTMTPLEAVVELARRESERAEFTLARR
jgi:hypothetical protein